jgi:4'-phosphopantetheinyl transferase EntD
VTRRWLGFEEARLTIDPDAGTFTAKLLVDGARVDGGPPLSVLNGRFSVGRGLILTALSAVLRAPHPWPRSPMRRSSM